MEWIAIDATVILTSKADTLTEGTARHILEHNRTWKAVCRP
ncbi:MAG: hypothetical protein FD176_1704 [Rhodospirillaceae bacterium]|nr:MAG: hypothetical protein FD176_1704 [Rhodospirillaceae bacterium]